MRWLKICALVIATLAAMRLGSWTVGWILAKLARIRPRFAAIAANLAAFAVFATLLLRDLLPGESVDPAALLFGLAVFAVCGWTDLHWTPWKPRGWPRPS